MAPQPCEQHARKIDSFGERITKTESRLEKGDNVIATLVDSVKRIEMAVCGNPALGIPGLVSLHARVESLERWRTRQMAIAATLGFVFGNADKIISFFSK